MLAMTALPRRVLARLRVLVVDDDEDARDAMAAALGFYGADVTCAASAGDAREELARAEFDILLSDINMPDEDGYALMTSVRRSHAHHIAAAAVSARSSLFDRERAAAAGFDDLVAKPFDVSTLVAAVASLASLPKR